MRDHSETEQRLKDTEDEDAFQEKPDTLPTKDEYPLQDKPSDRTGNQPDGIVLNTNCNVLNIDKTYYFKVKEEIL